MRASCLVGLAFLLACSKTNETPDGSSCKAPKVLRYETPGCDGTVQPICGFSMQDGCNRFACGCDDETVTGCDFYDRPYQSLDICPGACYGPSHNLEVVEATMPDALIKGCACDPATDQPQCIHYRAWVTSWYFTCAGGTWTVDRESTCTN